MTQIHLPTHKGRVAWRFGDNFDVDQVIGVANIKIQNEADLANVVMSQFEDGFRSKIRPGDVLVGGHNFGYGHPHAISMRAMRYLGIKAVIAESFFSFFWIGEIGYGFPLLICPGITQAAERFDEIELNFDAAKVTLPRKNIVLSCGQYSDREKLLLAKGGLKNLLLSEREQGCA